MDIWITSDLHFKHGNIIKYCSRPFSSVKEMDDYLLDEIRFKVKPNDQVYFLGDFMFGSHNKKYYVDNFNELFQNLPGQWFFCVGNHDKNMWRFRDTLLKNQRIKEIRDIISINYNQQKIVLSHCQMKVWDCKHHGAVHFYGHEHSPSGTIFTEYAMDVGIDTTNMKLLNIKDHLERLKGFQKSV